jgi:hypothetical protein
MTEPQHQQRQRALAARDELFGRLMKRLASILATDGPSKAVAVCKTEAPAIANAVSSEHGLRIGRTSHKLRNPTNRPPEWAREWVASRTTEATFKAHPDGRLGVLLPIHLKAQCVVCHGSPAQFVDSVRLELAASYPDDQAVGFEVGDLRGWFWIEVPQAH